MRASTREAIAQASAASETLSELLYAAGVNEDLGSPQAVRLLSMSNHADAASKALAKISAVRTIGVSNV